MLFSAIIRKIKFFDWTFFILILLLLILGLTIQYSLSLGLESDNFFIFKKHLAFIILGLIVFFLLSFFDFRILKQLAPLLYLFIVLLLIFVLILGKPIRGVKGWYFLGLAYFQPVELAKIVFIIIMAKIITEKIRENNELKKIILSGILLSPLFFLTLLQPDFGSAIIFILIWLFLISLNIQKIKNFFFIIIFLILIFLFFWQFILKDYQKARIITFFSPYKDPLGRGYQILQAKIAIGSGKLFGRGIGYGSQGQMKFLPASRTDFIFAALAEELGFFGSLLLIFLFTLLFLKIIRISKVVYDNFSLFVVLGIGFNLFLHVIINLSMNLGLLPIVGIPLPLISYGGSCLIATLISLGIIESIIIHQEIPSY